MKRTKRKKAAIAALSEVKAQGKKKRKVYDKETRKEIATVLESIKEV
jgi:hypothetical protein